jgi:hypothetical protein
VSLAAEADTAGPPVARLAKQSHLIDEHRSKCRQSVQESQCWLAKGIEWTLSSRLTPAASRRIAMICQSYSRVLTMSRGCEHPVGQSFDDVADRGEMKTP